MLVNCKYSCNLCGGKCRNINAGYPGVQSTLVVADIPGTVIGVRNSESSQYFVMKMTLKIISSFLKRMDYTIVEN